MNIVQKKERKKEEKAEEKERMEVTFGSAGCPISELSSSVSCIREIERERDERSRRRTKRKGQRERDRAMVPQTACGDQEMNTGTLFPYHHIHLPVLDVCSW